MASGAGDSVERANSKSPVSQMDSEGLIDDNTAHLEKISDYKTYAKVSQPLNISTTSLKDGSMWEVDGVILIVHILTRDIWIFKGKNKLGGQLDSIISQTHYICIYLCTQGLMDIALLSANANQLRHAMELCAPYRSLLIVLFSLSIVLQVVASCLLLVERITCRKKDYVKCRV